MGREDILNRIDKAFSTGRGPRIAVLQGMGGQGKSQVALEYCHQKKNNPYSTIFWVDATNENTVIESFQSISEYIKTPTDFLADSSARVEFVLRAFMLRSTSWLMVFDNYDDPDIFQTIQDYFPDGMSGAILVTGRHAGASALVVEHNLGFIELPGLEKDAALDLLLKQSQIKISNSEDAEKILERLGYHPLAVTQAGAYIRKRKIKLCEFLDEYKSRRKKILENTPQLSQYRKKLGSAEKETSLNVFTTWELSFEQLQSQVTRDGVETKILTLFAFFDDKDISEKLFVDFFGVKRRAEITTLFERFKGFINTNRQWDPDCFKDVLIRLTDLSLVQAFSQEPDGFHHLSLHPLIRDWIQLRTEGINYQENVLMAAILVGELIASYWYHGNFALPLLAKQSILIQVIAQEENYETYSLLQTAPPFSQSYLVVYISMQDWFAKFLSKMGSYERAEKISQRVKAEREVVFGIEHPSTLNSMINLAFTYGNQGRWSEAEKLEVQVLEIGQRILGKEHPSTLTSMINLATTYRSQGRWAEAEKLEVQVLKTRKRVLGKEHLDTLTSMNNLASTYQSQGRWAEAEKLEAPVIETRRRVLGKEHPDTLASMTNLAYTYRNQGRWAEAEKLGVQLIETKKRVLGKEHPDTLCSMSNLAHTYKAQSLNDKAIELMKIVVEMCSKVIGAKHPNTIDAMDALELWQAT